jgi:hypothetical protein
LLLKRSQIISIDPGNGAIALGFTVDLLAANDSHIVDIETSMIDRRRQTVKILHGTGNVSDNDPIKLPVQH